MSSSEVNSQTISGVNLSWTLFDFNEKEFEEYKDKLKSENHDNIKEISHDDNIWTRTLPISELEEGEKKKFLSKEKEELIEVIRNIQETDFEEFVIEEEIVFDEIIIGIGENTDKKYMFSSNKRAEFVETVFKKNDNVTVKTYSGLTVEKSIALTNRKISNIDTVFFLTSVENSYISSSIVRELIRNNGDYQLFIPKGITI